MASSAVARRLLWLPGMIKKPARRMNLSRTTLRTLTSDQLDAARGGWIRPPISWSCPQPAPSSSNCPKDVL